MDTRRLQALGDGECGIGISLRLRIVACVFIALQDGTVQKQMRFAHYVKATHLLLSTRSSGVYLCCQLFG